VKGTVLTVSIVCLLLPGVANARHTMNKTATQRTIEAQVREISRYEYGIGVCSYLLYTEYKQNKM
jgi:imidazoleglycerol phosphate synthase glutamine amidotransferase subunit HisH